MSNPFEYREVMKAAFHYNETRTVDEVVAQHKAQHEARDNANRRNKQFNGATPTEATGPVAPPMSAIPADAMKNLHAMLAQVATVKDEPASLPSR